MPRTASIDPEEWGKKVIAYLERKGIVAPGQFEGVRLDSGHYEDLQEPFLPEKLSMVVPLGSPPKYAPIRGNERGLKLLPKKKAR